MLWPAVVAAVVGLYPARSNQQMEREKSPDPVAKEHLPVTEWMRLPTRAVSPL